MLQGIDSKRDGHSTSLYGQTLDPSEPASTVPHFSNTAPPAVRKIV